MGNDPLNRYDVRGLLKASQYVWNVEWQLNWSAEYQNGITGDFTTTGGVSVYGDGRGTLIVSGRNFSLTFTGIEGAMSFEYKKALEEGRIYLEYLRNMMWTSVYFEKLDASFKAQIMDASGSLIKFPNPLKEDDVFFYHDPRNPNYWYERMETEREYERGPWDCSYCRWQADILSGLLPANTPRYTTKDIYEDTPGAEYTPGDISTWHEGDYLVFPGHIGSWTENYRGKKGMWHNSSYNRRFPESGKVNFMPYGSAYWNYYISNPKIGWPWRIPHRKRKGIK